MTVLLAASVTQIVIYLILAIGCIGILLIVARVSGIQIPNWFWQILAIVVLVVIAIFAVRFISSI